MSIKYTPSTIGPGIGSMEQLNNEFQKIQAALARGLSRYPLDVPNAMQGPLDMGSQDILNVGSITATDIEVGGISLDAQIQTVLDAVDEVEGYVEAAQLAVVAAQGAANAAEAYKDQAEAAYNNILFLDVVTETGNFTIDDTYTNKMVIVDSSSGVTCTIGGSSVGCQVLIVQGGSGAITFSSSDTILTRDGLTTNGEGAVASVIQYAESAVYLNGQLE